MKYLLMTSIVATLLVVPACERRDYKDDPAYNSEGKDAPPSPVSAKDNPTVLADQMMLARQILAARAAAMAGSTSKPASQPAPATGATGGTFFDPKGAKLPVAVPPAADSKPADADSKPADAASQPTPETAPEPAAPPKETPKDPVMEPTPGETPAGSDTPASE